MNKGAFTRLGFFKLEDPGVWGAASEAIAVPEAIEGSLEKLGTRVEIRHRLCHPEPAFQSALRNRHAYRL